MLTSVICERELKFISSMEESPPQADIDVPPDFSAYDGQAFYITDGHVILCAFVLLSAILVSVVSALLKIVAKQASRSRNR